MEAVWAGALAGHDRLLDMGGVVASAVVPESLTRVVGDLSSLAAVSEPEVRIFMCMFLAYPLGGLWRQLPGATARHVFSIVLGSWMLMFTFQAQWVHVPICALLCYAIMALGGPRSRYITASVAMLYLSCMHLYRQFTAYMTWSIDVTFSQMIMTQKIFALAFNYYDGSAENVKEEHKVLATKELPSLLEYFSFLLFPAGVIMGPTIEFRDYMTFADGDVDVPAPYLPSLWRFVQGLVYLAINTVANMYLPVADLLTDDKFLSSGTIVGRFLVQLIALFGYRTKYYFGWKFAEGAVVMSGIGYRGFDKVTGKQLWDRVEAIDVKKFELPQSVREAVEAWNKTTNQWLRKYAYDRVRAPYNLYAAYGLSAFWHGFYPGYYMFFMTLAFCTAVHRKIRRTIRPYFLAEDGKSPGKYKWLYDILSVVAAVSTMEYLIISFILLSWEAAIKVYRSQWFIGHIIAVVAYVVLSSGIIPKRKLPSKTQ